MGNIILSADSTCDIGPELKARYDVHFYPFHILFEGHDYLDNVTITSKTLFDAYYRRKVLPQTAAINVSEYLDYFREWVDNGFEVIHFNLGSGISSAHKNCMLAAKALGGHVHVVDSCNLSTGIGLQVIEAGNRIAAGLSASEIVEEIRELIPKCRASFIVDTLDFLRAGGRCSTLAAMGANLLNIKPCIEVNTRDGSMHVGKKYRGALEKVLVQYTKDTLRRYANIKTEHVFITSAHCAPAYREKVRQTIAETMDFQEIHITEASCTIAAHCGPNTLGVLFETL